MKKPVKEIKVFCDICDDSEFSYRKGVARIDELARYKCLVCKKDLCPVHGISISAHLERLEKTFRAVLCPTHALPLLPIFQAYAQFTDIFESAGHNPEFNQARLAEIIQFLLEEEFRGKRS